MRAKMRAASGEPTRKKSSKPPAPLSNAVIATAIPLVDVPLVDVSSTPALPAAAIPIPLASEAVPVSEPKIASPAPAAEAATSPGHRSHVDGDGRALAMRGTPESLKGPSGSRGRTSSTPPQLQQQHRAGAAIGRTPLSASKLSTPAPGTTRKPTMAELMGRGSSSGKEER